MKSIYMRFPNFNALILILLLLTFLTALNKCAAQTMPVDYDVLKYLLGRSQKAYYMERELAHCDSTTNIQNRIIENKDSLITNRNEALHVCEAEKEVVQLEVDGLINENKSIKKKVSFFKFTTILAAIIGSISTIYFIAH